MINMEEMVDKQDGDDANAVKIGSKRNGDTNKMKSPRAKLKFELDKTRLPLVSGKGNYRKAGKARERWQERGNEWDSVTIGARKLPADIKYMVVDVETHDWRKESIPDGRIVEIAWKLFNQEESCVESKQYLLKPHGYNEIAQKATAVHGITTECAISHGSDANLVFNELIAILNVIPHDGFVIAYRMFHEHSIFMCNLTQEQKNAWVSTPKCDVYSMKLWKYLPDGLRDKYTKMKKRRTFGVKLTELHNIICASPKSYAVFAHMAFADVEMTWDIFKYYKQEIDKKAEVNSHEELEWKQNKGDVRCLRTKPTWI